MLILFLFFYYELIFGLFAGSISEGQGNLEHMAYMFLFSVAYSGIFYIITSIWSSERVRHILRDVFLLITPVIYLVPYFIFCEFGVFYDLNTMLGGASDAVTGFTDDIIKLITSKAGVSIILLMFAPFILYTVYIHLYPRFFRKYIILAGGNPCRKLSSHSVIKVAEVVLITYLTSIMLVYGSEPASEAYNSEYTYEKAIRNFGVASAYRMEIKNLMKGEDNSFEDMDVASLYQPPVTKKVSNRLLAVAGFGNVIDTAVSPSVSGNSVSGNTVSGNTVSANKVQLAIDNRYTDTGFFAERNVQDIDFAGLSSEASGALADLDSYVSSLSGTSKNSFTGLFEGKNLIFITAEAFTAEAIDAERTPTLYRLATKGINFTDYYQPASAGTTGGEYSNIMGMLPSAGGKSMKETATHLNYMTLGNQLNNMGYYGKAYHNNDYTYYDRHLTHVNLGYSDGYMGYGNGMEEFVSAKWPESDLEMMEGTLPTYIDKQPFNIYYMSVSGHSLYDKGCNAMSKIHWDTVENLECSDRIKGYLACQVELDAALEYLVTELENAGIADDTVIVISADHYPYGLDADGGTSDYPYLTELYGCDITNNFVRDHNRLIIWSGCLEDCEPIVVDDPVFSPDVLPTLLNLFNTGYDSRMLPGRDVFSDAMPLVYDLGHNWKTDLGTYAGGRFTPVSEDTVIPDNYVKSVKSIVANKISFSKGVLNNDYYRHVYGGN